jgi:hypothetical protein
MAAILMVGLCMPVIARAQDEAPLSQADQAAIRVVIEAQLAAFQRDDAAAAFAHASPRIQQRFGDAETFMAMVKSSYRPVYRPARVTFRDLRWLNGVPAQFIDIIGADGRPVVAGYIMERQADGRWRIGGVFLTTSPDQVT